MTALEHRYLMLLRAYPAEHRRAYQQEMLGVLMESTRPGQRWPSPQDAVLLLRHGAGARLKALRPGAATGPWAHACAIFGLFAAALLSAWHSAWLVEQVDLAGRLPGLHLSMNNVALTVAWILTLTAALAGRRQVAAVVGVVAALGDLYLLGQHVAQGIWLHSVVILPVTLGLAGAAALVVAARRREPALNWAWRSALVITAALMVVAARSPLAGWTFVYPSLDLRVDDWLVVGIIPVLTWLGVLAIRVSGPVRRRLFALGVPVLAELVYDNRTGGARDLYNIGWFVVVACAIPALSFAVAYVWVARRDRLLRLAALGRAAESAEPTGEPAGAGMLGG